MKVLASTKSYLQFFVITMCILDVIFLFVPYSLSTRKKKCALTRIQKELNDAQKRMKIYHKIRWLSRFQAISTLCDSLEFVIVYFCDELKKN